MQTNTDTWESYCEHEMARAKPVLEELGYVLEAHQPHILGERKLTGSGNRKVVLLGKDAVGNRVVIKASSERGGIEEMSRERKAQELLERIGFAYQALLSPKELFWGSRGGITLRITEFIEQDRPFLERPVEEQFFLALKAFKAQESAHATTASHLRAIQNVFGEVESERYVAKAELYAKEIRGHVREERLAQALELLRANTKTIERYGGFLTHWDFTPQNFRVRGKDIYMLDHFSVHFGNKYEGWARFINFMALYNPPLGQALEQYVRDNRAPEELLSLKLMRVYRLLELIRYYVSWLPRTEGNLHELAQARISFWSEVLTAALDDREVPAGVVEEYKKVRDSLRSEDEKRRQAGLH